MIEKFVKVAESQVGYKEGKNNATKYGIWYGMPNQPWCAMFVSWCANKAGILNTLVPKYAACSVGYNWFKNKGLIVSKPKAGYVGFLMNSKGNPEHTFIVKSVSGNKIITIEGNLDNAVRINTRTISSKLKFGIVEQKKDEWTTGIYKLLYKKAWRKTHKITNNIYQYVKAGTDVRINEIYKEGNRVWGKCGAFWFVLCNKKGKPQAKKIS